ncbi:GNAT family N-acetyltransferase [Micromonospora inyonensis]|uniref:Protein N-acetyltransferase, RimJ/RimL family n=1 Tax=Micromonospora inyonensis TaxID=47866 RepID=A0A1C6RQX3_9ACTN|nr:GNAT family N-acetyltransferase [Micromonospora inyonensis]SCL19428.1 Protein N-acetyltransferase, RimJ/RimL family [Micromonospora inyonensis]
MNDPVVTRYAMLADLAQIVDLHTRARLAYYQAGGLAADAVQTPTVREDQRTGWTEAIESPHKRVLCATVGHEIVGVAAMGPPLESAPDTSRAGQLYQIHVVPGRWGNGIGGVLHGTFLDYLADAGLSLGLIEVWERNTRALAFYQRYGWRPDGGSRPGPDHSRYLFLRLALTGDHRTVQ